MIANPIWKDTYYVTTADTLSYRILLDGEEIYAGKAVKYPDADELKINLNKVCSNYLESNIMEEMLETMPTAWTSFTDSKAIRRFDLEVDGTVVESYIFYNDWSYENRSYNDFPYPINGHYVSGMLYLQPSRAINLNTGTCSQFTHTRVLETIVTGRYWKKVKCAPYVLYYLTSYGNWEAFVIEGNTTKKDTFTTYTTDRAYNNNTLEFENNKYVQEIKTTYVMNTGLLTDEQSKNLAKNLIGSIKVYLQNVEEGWAKPVVITDSSVDYQTYATNGQKLSQYKITVQESQSKVRK